MTGEQGSIISNVIESQGHFHSPLKREIEFQLSTTLETYFDSFMDLMDIEENYCVINA